MIQANEGRQERGRLASKVVPALQAVDAVIERHGRLRALADFDIRKLASARYLGSWRWVALGVFVAVVVVVAGLLALGELDDFYLWIRQHDPFPGDRAYTHVMRDYPLLYVTAGVGVVVVLLLVLPRRLWLNEVIVMTASGTTGFIGGHAFW